MQNQPETQFHKTVIMNRAVSGSGKTTLSRCVTEALHAKGLSVAVHSTDDFFMKDGRYVFDLGPLNSYHARNLANFTADLERGTDVVICDNMNLLPWQSQPYTNAARKNRYRILFLNFLPRELEKHLAAQVVTPEKPDAHGLSKELLERFIRNFNDYNDLLDRNTVRDIRRHRVFVWNDVDKIAMDTGELAQHFDSDAVITIRPEEYHEMKKTLAGSVLQIISESDEDLKRRGIKKHYLLTWYGITDIRASMGLEPTDGPVMSALRTGRYTDVIVLGYTNPNKPKDAFSGALREEWEKLRALPPEARLAYPRAKTQVMVDALCNTETAHEHFLHFLQSAGIPARIRLEPHELSHLNDAMGIDDAARLALRLALSDETEKDITCFLSPGTPVMAYTWGMVCRMNPELNLHVIASSDPRKPPEEINLPKPPVAAGGSGSELPTSFDVVIHLLGTDTNSPQHFSMVQFPARKHWVITSADSTKASGLCRLLPPGATLERRDVNPFVPMETRKAVEAIVRSFPPTTRIGINLTGGTKLMFVGALNACNEFPNVEPFYFDIKQHNFTFIRTGAEMTFPGVRTIDGFFTSIGYDLATKGFWEDNPAREARKELTLKLWEKRTRIEGLFRNDSFCKYAPGRRIPNPPFHFSVSKVIASLKGSMAKLVLDEETTELPDCPDFGKYIGGGWLEEYTYLQLLPLVKAGKIFDLRIGVETVREGQILEPGDMPVGELDCVFTDGFRLFIVECKTGILKQDHIQKLKNNCRDYAGIAGRGFLVTSFPVCRKHLERIGSEDSIQYIPEEEMNTEGLLRRILL